MNNQVKGMERDKKVKESSNEKSDRLVSQKEARMDGLELEVLECD